jgi:hypothetical protein
MWLAALLPLHAGPHPQGVWLRRRLADNAPQPASSMLMVESHKGSQFDGCPDCYRTQHTGLASKAECRWVATMTTQLSGAPTHLRVEDL